MHQFTSIFAHASSIQVNWCTFGQALVAETPVEGLDAGIFTVCPGRIKSSCTLRAFFLERLREHVLLSSMRSATRRFSRAFYVLERPPLAQLADAQVGAFLLPDVEGRFADAQLPADVRLRRSALHLPQGLGDSFFGELRSLHGPHPLIRGPRGVRIS